MAVTIEGVPESLTREQYKSLIAAVGLDTSRVKSLEFRMDGVYAEVGTGKFDMLPDKPDREATHRVYIPIKD